jgi:phosphoglycerate dehydrogenase-like enzyme
MVLLAVSPCDRYNEVAGKKKQPGGPGKRRMTMTINVIVTASFGKECLRKIESVSPEVKVCDISGLTPGDQKKLDTILAQTDIIFGSGPPPDVLKRAPKLKWIQCMYAGVNHFITPEMVKGSVAVTSARGIHAVQVSELALELMLMCAKQAPRCFQNQQQKKWEIFIPVILRGKTLGLIGMGSIGAEFARISTALGMKVIVYDPYLSPGSAKDLDVEAKGLDAVLKESDFISLHVPATPETEKMLGYPQFKTMKKTAYVINTARGIVIDETALVRALDEGCLAGAGLDVTAVEPLPPESPLWKHPKVIITPHVAGRREDYDDLATDLFCQNLKRYLKGEKLLNIVNEKGF